MNLTRPLVVLDLEATGTDTALDRIVQVAYRKITADLVEKSASRLINPGMVIPAEATAIHHITNEMVATEPHFRQISKSFHAELQGCDLAGYNLLQFDIPLLFEEFYRCGIEWDLSDVRVVDAFALWQIMAPRKLADAVREFAGEEVNSEDMHDAAVDVDATVKVLRGQFARWSSKLGSIEEAAGLTMERRKKAIAGEECTLLDLAGTLAVRPDGTVIYTQRKVCGVPVLNDQGYANWMLRNSFTQNTKLHLMRVLGMEVAA